jgi:hypothetical protein
VSRPVSTPLRRSGECAVGQSSSLFSREGDASTEPGMSLAGGTGEGGVGRVCFKADFKGAIGTGEGLGEGPLLLGNGAGGSFNEFELPPGGIEEDLGGPSISSSIIELSALIILGSALGSVL